MLDLLLEDTGDLAIVNGDFVMGESTAQHQQLLMVAQRGQFKENPDRAVGIEDFINSNDIDGMLAEIRNQFTKDGMTVNQLNYDEQSGNLNYDAPYKS